MSNVYCVPHELVESVWGSVEKYLHDGIADADAEYTIDQLKTFLTSGRWKLIIALNEQDDVIGATAVSMIRYPDHCVAFLASIGGKMISNKKYIDELKELLKCYGADRIQGYVQDSVQRLYQRFDFNKKSVLVEMRI